MILVECLLRKVLDVFANSKAIYVLNLSFFTFSILAFRCFLCSSMVPSDTKNANGWGERIR